MKKIYGTIFRISLIFVFFCETAVFPQAEKTSSWDAKADFSSSYIWRGTHYAKGPVIMPDIKYEKGIFAAGCWGAFDFSNYQEADLYFSLTFPDGLSLGMTDYYYSDLEYFDYSRNSGSHAFEINFGYCLDNISLSANYIMNKAGGAGSLGNDLYFQADYSFDSVTLFAGAGNGWHTYISDEQKNRFRLCNIGIKTSRAITVTDQFSIPVTGQVIFNPDKEQLFVVIGFTL